MSWRGVRAPGFLVRARARSRGSWIGAFAARLAALDFGSWIVVFGASLMFSVLPLMILLGALANHRIDVDVSRHIGLDSRGAQVIAELFRYSFKRPTGQILLALFVALAGTLAVAGSLQAIYERAFDREHRGWRDIPRFAVWVAVLLAVVVVEALASRPVQDAVGPIVLALLRLVGSAVFFGWTMRFLLAGRAPWRLLIRPAILTALAWLGLAVFSTTYFSSTIVSDTRLYGTIGAVFTLLTWFVAIGAVIVLGAAGGVTWQTRSGHPPAETHDT